MSSIDTSLHERTKSNTNLSEYKTMFAKLKYQLRDFKFIYTDGSMTENSITYSVTTNNRIIKVSNLPTYSTIFSAELIAIYEAISFVKGHSGKFAICTDSLSSLRSIQNTLNNDYYKNKIRNILTLRFPDIKLIWTPGHCGIKGNEFADYSAKNAAKQPLCTTPNFSQKDLLSYVANKIHKNVKKDTFNSTSTWYRTFNNEQRTIYDFLNSSPIDTNRTDIIKYVRLRLGHTKATHERLIFPNCTPFCTCNISYPSNPSHFLCVCPKVNNFRISTFQNVDPLTLLSHPSFENILLLTKFLKNSNLYSYI